MKKLQRCLITFKIRLNLFRVIKLLLAFIYQRSDGQSLCDDEEREGSETSFTEKSSRTAAFVEKLSTIAETQEDWLE